MLKKPLITSMAMCGLILATQAKPTQAAEIAPVVVNNQAYGQLQATDDNLTQQIMQLTNNKHANTSINQARLTGLKVQQANVRAQIAVIDAKRASIKAAEVAKAKAKIQAAAIAKAKTQAAAVQAKTYSLPTVGGAREKLVAYAKQFVGVPYVWGGTTPSGFDCSGLTSYVYANVLGMGIGRTTWAQDATGVHVGLNELQPGDLIIENGVEHVTMYLGNGMQIEAPQPGDVVKIDAVPYNYGAMYGLRYLQ